MAATKLQRNWSAVSHNSVNITKVTNVSIDPGGKLIKFYGDGDLFPTTIVAQDSEPTASVDSGDIATIIGIAPGTTGTFTATHNDAKLAISGAIVYTLANAVARNASATGQRGQFGSATLTMDAFSSDGITNPLSFTRA